ncbi:hypothetical protein [Spirosoma fluminis]
MAAKKRKHKYPTDTESGIRRIDEIRKCPVDQLTDEEHVKAFMDRFGAKALLLAYFDEEGIRHVFGRLYTASQWQQRYRELLELAVDCGFCGSLKQFAND